MKESADSNDCRPRKSDQRDDLMSPSDTGISRRKFLEKSAFAVTGLAVAPGSFGALGRSVFRPDAAALSGEVTIWSYDTGSDAMHASLAALFNKKYPDVKVTYVFVPFDQLLTKIVSAAGARTGPDVLEYNIALFPEAVAVGAVADISKTWGAFGDRDQFGKAFVLKSGAKVYGIRPYGNLDGMYYNKAILKSAGITQLPTTLSAFTAALRTIKQKTNATPLNITGTANTQSEFESRQWLSGYGFNYAHPKQAALQDAFELVASWVKNGYVSREASTWDQTIPFQKFLLGNVAFCETGNWNLEMAVKQAHFPYGVMPMPRGPKGGGVYLGGEGYSVGAFSKSPALAWAFLKETYLSAQGELAILNALGSIPARADAGASHSVKKSHPKLAAFVQELKTAVPNPPPNVNPKYVVPAQLAVGQNWSAVIAGQKSPAQAAADTMQAIRQAAAQAR